MKTPEAPGPNLPRKVNAEELPARELLTLTLTR
jgi:hypothetical protein